ncbi:MAG: hypothetical protein FJ291_23485 [Planctomycetes bacterium]|nr:hypothetical protein [Planctomycetota bacterium]
MLLQSRIVDLLMGTELWGDPVLAVRELLQNALDACSHRLALSRRRGIGYTPKICFHIDCPTASRERDVLITCEDNGTGMDQHIVEDYLMRIGRSYYSSPEFRTQNLDLSPIGRFGLGLMSCFMLTDTVRIRTQRVDQDLGKGTPLLIEIDSGNRYVVIRRLSESREGTAISLLLGEGAVARRCDHCRMLRPHPMMRDHSLRGCFEDLERWHGDHMMAFEMVHHALTRLAVHLDVPVIVSEPKGHVSVIEPGEFLLPEIDWAARPCMRERYKQFLFRYTRVQTQGMAGVFRFILPCDSNGDLCLGCAVDSRFKMFTDPDGDLCLTTPAYRDKRAEMDLGLPDDWGTDEVRGVYRDKYGRKPPASESYDTDRNVLEVVKSTFRWSQDGLLVGDLDTPSSEGKRPKPKEDEATEGGPAALFALFPVPGLNGADIDIRGSWRLKLNVQRTRFVNTPESVDGFGDRFYALSTEMWRQMIEEAVRSSRPESVHRLLIELYERSDWRFKGYLRKPLGLKGNPSAGSFAEAYLAMITDARASEAPQVKQDQQ